MFILRTLTGALLVLTVACATATAPVAQSPRAPRTEPGAAPKGYGYTAQDPIKVGGGVEGEYEYLSFLHGPGGERLKVRRLGSCCPFEGADGGTGGLLDIFEVTYRGLEEPVKLYLNMYERDDPRAPEGFILP